MNIRLTFLVMLITVTSLAQQVQVISKSDLQPVANCMIYNQDKSASITTDNRGTADLSKFKSTDMLTFSHVSFISAVFEKSFFKDKITEIELTVAVINLQ